MTQIGWMWTGALLAWLPSAAVLALMIAPEIRLSRRELRTDIDVKD